MDYSAIDVHSRPSSIIWGEKYILHLLVITKLLKLREIQLLNNGVTSGKIAAICSRFSVIKLIFCPNYCFIHLNMHRQLY